MRGFSLPEMIVVVTIVGMVGVGVSTFIYQMYRGNAYVFEAATSLDNARRGLTVTIENLREASYGEDGSYPIASAATSTITFYADVDQDGPVERIRVYLNNGTMYRGVTNAAGNPRTYAGQTESVQTVIGFVRNSTSTPLFIYRDENGTQLTAPIDISRVAQVTMDIRVDLNPQRAPNVYNLSGSATLRNLIED